MMTRGASVTVEGGAPVRVPAIWNHVLRGKFAGVMSVEWESLKLNVDRWDGITCCR